MRNRRSFSSPLFFALAILPLLWQCASPPAKGMTSATTESGDDYRLVSREDFLSGAEGWHETGAVSQWKQDGQQVVLTLTDGRKAFFNWLSPTVVRFCFNPDTREIPSTTSVRNVESKLTSVTTTETAKELTIATPGFQIRIDKQTLGWSLLRGETTIFQTTKKLSWAHTRVAAFFDSHSAGTWSGLGLSGKGIVKNGQSVKFWNDLPGNRDETGPYSIPFVLGTGGAFPFALYLDNPYQSYINLRSDDAYVGALNGGLDLYVILGKSPRDIVQTFTDLTARPVWAPKWALGVSATIESAQTAQLFRAQKLAIEGARLTNSNDTLVNQAQGFRFHPIISVERHLLPAGDSAIGKDGVSKGYFSGPVPDFSRPETRTWWSVANEKSIPPGGQGWFLGSPLARVAWETRFWDVGRASLRAKMNNVYPVLVAQNAAESQLRLHPQIRPWIAFEAGFTGSTRWGTLELPVKAGMEDSAALSKILSGGLSGLGSVQVRLDLSALASNSPDSIWKSLALWVLNPYLSIDFGPNPQALWRNLGDDGQKRLKGLLALHSQLKPAFYGLTRAASQNGIPVLHPLLLDFSNDPKAVQAEDEFTIGDGLLAAPSFDDAKTRKVYLPGPTVWFDWYTGEEIAGGQTVEVTLNADRVPLFARAGTVVSLSEPEVFAGESSNPVTIHLFPGNGGETSLYSDDGESSAYKSGVYNETKILFSSFQREFDIEQQSMNDGGTFRSSESYVLYRLHNVYRPREVRIDNRAIPLFGDSWGVTDTDRSAAWYENDHTLLIKAFRPDADQVIQMSF